MTYVRRCHRCDKYWKHYHINTAMHFPYGCATYVSANNIKHNLWLHVKCPKFLSDLNWIFTLVTHFHKGSHYKISWKSFQWQPRWHMQTNRRMDRHYEANRRFSRLTQTRLKFPCRGNSKFMNNADSNGRYEISWIINKIQLRGIDTVPWDVTLCGLAATCRSFE